MANALCFSLRLVLLLSPFAMMANPLPTIRDQDFISRCVTAHNRARSDVSPPASYMRYMTWDDGLAVLARSWATHCLFQHNPNRAHEAFPSVGENIWAGAPPTSFEVNSAIQKWVDEVKDFDYSTLKCRNVCGHYTQVVWASTYKVGCAVISCPNGVRDTRFSHMPGAIFVCNYATSGNYVGASPYEEGRSCSRCGGEVCEENLCRNQTRDQTRDGGADLCVCGGFCVSVLIIRPVSLLVIFGSVYVVQHRCPNIFAYIN